MKSVLRIHLVSKGHSGSNLNSQSAFISRDLSQTNEDYPGQVNASEVLCELELTLNSYLC